VSSEKNGSQSALSKHKEHNVVLFVVLRDLRGLKKTDNKMVSSEW